MKKIFLVVIASFLTLACTEAKYAAHIAKQIPIPGDQQSVGHFKVGTPYTIMGRRYYPRESYAHTETGMASWYGPNFHGKQTANGEIFDKYELTAAHRTLQMPSIIRVTNVSNGRSVILRVNDRGPFAHDRILDVSERAATLLGFKDDGVTRVKIQVLPQESKQVASLAKAGRDTRGFEVALNNGRQNVIEHRTPLPPREPIQRIEVASESGALEPVQVESLPNVPPPGVSPRIYVQAGAFSQEQNALSLSNRLSTFGPSKVYLTRVNDQPFFRVRLGPYQDPVQAQEIASALLQNGNPNTKVVVD
jgi:rare lipoprotein A